MAVLRQARRHRLKTAVETCGMVPPETIRAAAPHLNHVLFDLKHMDPAVHKEQTGRENGPILENFRILVTEFPDLPILARTPVIPGFNDDEDAIRAIAEFVKPHERVNYERSLTTVWARRSTSSSAIPRPWARSSWTTNASPNCGPRRGRFWASGCRMRSERCKITPHAKIF